MAYQRPYYHNNPSGLEANVSYETTKHYEDDLVDEHAAPYSMTAGYKTYDLGGMHGQNVPYKGSYSTDLSMSAHDVSMNPQATHGYPPVMPSKEKDALPLTLWQKLIPESLACRLYVVTVLVETTVDLFIEGYIFSRFHQSKLLDDTSLSQRRMPVYLAVFVLAHVFQLILAVDAVYARNTLQFIFLTLFNALFFIYAIIQNAEIRENAKALGALNSTSINAITYVLPIVISLAEVAYIGLGWKIYNEFGWKVYKFLGADRRIKKMYALYQIYQCLVKFDVFFWVAFSVQLIYLVLSQTRDWEYFVTCAALPVSILLLIEGHLAARHENKMMMYTFMSGCGGAMVYFVYKLAKIIRFDDSDELHPIVKSLVTFAVMALILLLVTIVLSVLVLRNFGKGLKEAIDKNTTAAVGDVTNGHQRSGSKHLNRMSIN